MDVGNECALRIHIRKLLLHYSLTHLTIDYVTHTSTEVSEVSESVKTIPSSRADVVPLDDPTSLALPVDPFEALCKNLGVNDQKSYDQTWKMTEELRQYITNTLGKGQDRELLTERCWRTENETTNPNPCRPITPILTTRAIRQTPKIGLSSSSALIRSFSCCDSRYLEHVDIHGVADEPFEEVVFSERERDHILNIRPTLDKEAYGVIKSLLAQGTHLQPQSLSDCLPSMVSQFLCHDASPPIVNFPRPMSPPIFPRRLSKVINQPGLGKLSEIYSLGFVAPIEIKDEAVEDMSKAHMLIVDGWNVIAPPPTSQSASSNTPSLEAASQSSQMEVDELFALTPPQQLLTGSITDQKMEEYLIPRSHKPGGVGKKRLKESKPSSLATFLPQLLPPVVIEPNPPDITRDQSPPISLSILGQPPSPSKSSVTNQSTVHRQISEKEIYPFNVELDTLITQLCAPVDGQTAEDIIIREKLEENEALMMDVPKLKEPYLHPNSPSCPILPTSVRSLVSSKKHTQPLAIVDPKPSSIYLKKVTGVQSLNIELSWRPFNFGTSIPKTDELADVDRHPTLNSQAGLNPVDDDAENELKNLLAVAEHGTGAEESLRADLCGEPATDWAANLSEDWGRYDVVLTRAERRRVSGHQGTCLYETEVTEIRKQTFEDTSCSEGVPSPVRSHKRRKVVSASGTDLLGGSKIQRDTETVQDLDGAQFSFHNLCSPELDFNSQALSEDAPFWNSAGDVPDAEILQVGGSNFLDHYSDPIWTAEAAAQSLVDGHYTHMTTVSAGTIVDNRRGSSPTAQNICPRNKSPIQSPDPVLPSHDANMFSVPVAPTRLSNTRRSEKAAAQEALSDFMKLRGKVIHEPTVIFASQPEPEPELRVEMMSSPRPVPTELTDTNALNLPDEWISPVLRHRYVASLDVLQKTTLLKRLASLDCNVELVERDTSATKGVDLIIDADTAVLFVPLAPLPVSGEALAQKIAKLSWDFDYLVLVFEAFSTSLSYRTDKNGSGTVLTPYAFSPAIVKALRKLKRTLAILDGMVTGNKRRDMKVRYAYARDVGEAARFARLVGDMAENALATTAMMGDSREWLTDDYHEDEIDLAQIKGMNVYAAAMVLRHVDFNTFVDMEPGNRFEMFSAMVGAQRITMFNEEIANRLTHIAISSSPLLSHAAQSTASSIQPMPESFEDISCYGDEHVEIAEEREDSHHYRERQGIQEDDDSMEWQTTSLLMIPGKGQLEPPSNQGNFSI